MTISNKFILGLIINPISGMGGSVGLKGTDGEKVLKKAIELGGKPYANQRAKEFLDALEGIKSKIKFITCPRFMGESSIKKLNFEYDLIKLPIFDNIKGIYDTNSEHTKAAAHIMKSMEDLRLILFVGGDGTARNILDAVGDMKPCLGIPSGVKIYSSVFSLTPTAAASTVIQFLWDELSLTPSEVLDIDEVAYRKGDLISKLYGYLITPHSPEYSQYSKLSSPDTDQNNQERIADKIIEDLEDDVYYLLGPGTTVKAITDKLGLQKTLLGVDLLYNKQIIALDLNEKEILAYIKKNPPKIIVSLIGRQGFLFGRGNLQFTPKILKLIPLRNIIIIATKFKLTNLPDQCLRVDSRDPDLDAEMRGLYKVITDYDEVKIIELK
jgi:predicted polyphosphate/ATP-dependent NAD kinase